MLSLEVDEAFGWLAYVIGEPVQAPTTMPWSNRSLLFREPDGNLVNFLTPVDAEATEKHRA